jgi:nucleotide-binding universal stress UspA family protein
MMHRNPAMNATAPSQSATGISLRLNDVNFQRVLVPVDFSVCTLETLRYAKTLMEKTGVVVDVLHVVQPSYGRNEATMPGSSLIRTMIEGARQELKKLAEILCPNEVKPLVSVRVREGRVDVYVQADR